MMMSSAPAKSSGDARYASQDPFNQRCPIQSRLQSLLGGVRSFFVKRNKSLFIYKIELRWYAHWNNFMANSKQYLPCEKRELIKVTSLAVSYPLHPCTISFCHVPDLQMISLFPGHTRYIHLQSEPHCYLLGHTQSKWRLSRGSWRHGNS